MPKKADDFPAPFTEEPTPIETVDIDEAIAQVANPESAKQGKRFWFGDLGVIWLDKETKYFAQKNHATVTDPVLIEKLLAFAKEHPSHKIIPQD